jgi:2-oxoglutarate/2-oxoacid ferredoxin oxidoreductase subunit beta
MTAQPVIKLGRKDLMSDQEVRWCPGCGDYAILKSVQGALAGLGVAKENMVVISGIGCAARFPYYMDTYGFHSIHGRAPAFATGAKMANPDLSVWVIGGDGDMMSIGGNHLIHALRRNIDLTVLLFNNRIYGLTKGQFSPTSGLGIKTKSSPMGSIDRAFNPLALALGAGATFVGRSVDVWGKHLEAMVAAAHAHKGTSFIEILQNCIIFNKDVHDDAIGRASKAEHSVDVVHGEPLIFGANGDKGIRLKGFTPEVVNVADVDASELLKHDEAADSPAFAQLLASFDIPDLPVTTGILRRVQRPTYEASMDEQVALAQAAGRPSLDDLFAQGDTWTVE